MAATALSPRAQDVLERVQSGAKASDIANDLGVTRNAVYQQIGKLRRDGYLPDRPQNGPAKDEPLSVEATVTGFKANLEAQIRQIDAREQDIQQELARLRDSRIQVEEILARFDS